MKGYTIDISQKPNIGIGCNINGRRPLIYQVSIGPKKKNQAKDLSYLKILQNSLTDGNADEINLKYEPT